MSNGTTFIDRRREKNVIYIAYLLVGFLCIIFLPLKDAFADTLSEADRAIDLLRFDLIDARGPISEYQIRSRSSDYKTDKGGLCNVSSIATLLNRRLAADYRTGRFTVANVFKSLGCKNYKTDGKLYSDKSFGQKANSLLFQYWYKEGDTGIWCTNNRKYTNDSCSYTVTQISGSTVKKATTKANFYTYIAGLLHKHPEGIAIRNKTANHVAVIYKYSYSNGKYTLYVKDPVGNTSGILENSYIYKQSGYDLYSNIDFLVYINGTAAVCQYEASAPQSIALSSSVLSVNLSENATLSATVIPSNSNPGMVWASSNEAVATVSSSGVIAPHSVGETIITVKSAIDNTVVSSCKVTTYYQDSDSSNSLKFNGIKYPHQYVQGSNYTWSGSVESDVDLKTVTVHFYADKEYTYEASISLGTKKFTMSSVGSALLKELPLGNFTFSISATDVCNRRIGFSNSSSIVVSNGSNTSWDCKNTFQRPMLLGSGERNGHRYEVFQSTSKDWEYDRDYANEKGGHLLFIEDEGENTYISDLGKNVGAAWIYTGGYYDGSSWVWLDGTPVTYFAWRSANIPVATYLYPTVIGLGTSDNLWGRASKNEFSYFVIEYEPIKVSDIVISAEQEVIVGDSITINVEAYPENAYNSEIELISSNPDIAIVDTQNHRITGISEGWATITAKATDEGGAEKSFDLWVQHAMVHPIEIKVSADSSLYTNENTIEINIGASVELQTEFIPSNTDDQSVTYISSNEEIAYIEDYSSIVIPVSAGECEITARSNDGGLLSSITVIVLPVSGECGNNLTWCKNGTELTITGTGAMYDYTYDTAPWGKDITSVSFSEGVTSIGHYAFYGCTELRSVSGHPSVTSIGAASFEYCSSLPIFNIGANVKEVGVTAFAWCSSLTYVSIPASVEYIGEGAFCYCETLETIIVDATNTHYYTDESALFGKDGTLVAYLTTRTAESYTIPDGIKRIGAWCFANAKNIKTLTVPDSVVEFGHDAVESSGLTTIKCFEDSTAHTFAIENNIQYVLMDSPLINPDFVLPTGTKYIEEEAFAGIAAKRIKLPEGVTEIEANAFANCLNLKQIYIPDGCERIATTAFEGITNLTIYGVNGSYAQWYASRHGFTFKEVK